MGVWKKGSISRSNRADWVFKLAVPSAVSNVLSRLWEAPMAQRPMERSKKTARLIALLSLSLGPGWTVAQDLPVTEAPGPALFQTRRPLETTFGRAYTVNFDSAFVTGYPTNDRVPIYAYMPEGEGPFPVVIVLHYWGASDLSNERTLARKLVSQGVGAVLMELPYHLTRSPAGTRSGQLAVQPDPERLKDTMTQAIFDVRRTVDWISAQPEFAGQKIGIAGTSLGAIVGGLAFAVEPRFSAFCSVLGGTGLSDIIWESARLVKEREQLRRKGFTREKLREALASIEPGTYLRPDDTRPIFAIGARYDTVVPRHATERLLKATANVDALWLDTGHYGGFTVQGSLLGTVANFFDRTFEGEDFQPPVRLYAPTLRLSSMGTIGGSLDVALGLDIWKGDAEGRLFASFLITPRGPAGFVGGKVSTGLSIGLVIQQRRTAPGAFWSFVL